MFKIAAIIGGVLLMAGVALAGTVTSLDSAGSPTITQASLPAATTTVRQEDRRADRRHDRGRERELRGRANEPGEDVRGREAEPGDDRGHEVEPGDDRRGDRSGPDRGRGHDDGGGHGSGHGGHGGDD
jgi:hypothetical protein